MHHRPSGPPLSARLTGALTGVVLVFRGRLGRLLGAALLTTTVVGLVLAIPVVSGAGGESPSVTLDAASSSASDDEVSSPVVMGLDGRPLPPTTSAQTSTTVPPSSSSAAADSPEVAAAPDTTDPAPPATSAHAPNSSSSQPPSTPRTTAPGSTPTSTAGSSTTPTTPSSPSSPTSSAERPAAEPNLSDDAREALALVNAARADVGCTALHPDAGLISAAEAQSASQELELDGLVGVVAQGRPNAQSAVSSWLADEAGSAALLDCARTSAGVAAIDGWWTLLLA